MRRPPTGLAALFVLLGLALHEKASGQPVPLVNPRDLGVAVERLSLVDAAVLKAIERGELPGAVVVVVHKGKVIFRKAYGSRSIAPEKTPMSVEIVFDLASLTKPIATATSILLLIEEGKLGLADRVAKHLPAFRRKGKEDITVEQLLLHTSGFIADNSLKDYLDGRDKALQRLDELLPKDSPGTKFVYSDVGYIFLGQLVEKAAGKPLDVFARERIFAPLGMNDTAFNPQGKLKDRAAPTEKRDGRWQPGVVHDPRAYHLGGVAGHAGLFSTADDLAIYARMLLRSGDRLLKKETAALMCRPHSVPLGTGTGLRGLGWDVQTAYSKSRGDLFPSGKSFGHTGFTGTGIWLDPASETAVIFLSHRVHPDGKGNVTRLRGEVATLVASALPEYAGKR